MPTGTVKWYNETKGFGFIKSDEGGELFVHRSAIAGGKGTLEDGQRVEFEVGESPKGLMATNVRPAGANEDCSGPWPPVQREGPLRNARPPGEEPNGHGT